MPENLAVKTVTEKSPALTLYYSPAACSLAPHIVAREAGLEIELVEVDLATRTLKDGSDFHAINPRGYVPALRLADGTVLTEVASLVQYLADLAPKAALAPAAGTLERVKLQAWLTFISSELHRMFSPWLWHKDTAESTVRSARARIATRFTELDSVLSAQPFLMGEHFSVADAYAFAIVNWSNFLSIDLGAYPALAAYMQRIAQRPAVKQAMISERLIKAAA
jgi:glutathione S-transferase